MRGILRFLVSFCFISFAGLGSIYIPVLPDARGGDLDFLFNSINADVRVENNQVVINNLNGYDWKKCKLEINSGFMIKGVTIKGGETYKIAASRFVSMGGAKFNPYIIKPMRFGIFCKDVNGVAADWSQALN